MKIAKLWFSLQSGCSKCSHISFEGSLSPHKFCFLRSNVLPLLVALAGFNQPKCYDLKRYFVVGESSTHPTLRELCFMLKSEGWHAPVICWKFMELFLLWIILCRRIVLKVGVVNVMLNNDNCNVFVFPLPFLLPSSQPVSRGVAWNER